MPAVEIGLDDPAAEDVRELLAVHLTFSAAGIPIEDDHALDVEELTHPSITFVSARQGGRLLAVGALRNLGAGHGELKSMHTTQAARGQGIGSAVLACLIAAAREQNLRYVSLETGSQPWFTPARALYVKAGFVEAAPFGNYRQSPNSVYMTLELTTVV